MSSEQLGAPQEALAESSCPAQFVEVALRIWERMMALEGSVTSAGWDSFK